MLTREQIEYDARALKSYLPKEHADGLLQPICDQALLAIELQAENERLKAYKGWIKVSDKTDYSKEVLITWEEDGEWEYYVTELKDVKSSMIPHLWYMPLSPAPEGGE